MLKILAILFGLFMIVLGILGFLPDFSPNNKLLTLFLVNPMHNILHIVTGIVALICGLTSSFAAKLFFLFSGILYGILAFMGFQMGQGLLFGSIAINPSDNWLNAIIAVVNVYLGLFIKRS